MTAPPLLYPLAAAEIAFLPVLLWRLGLNLRPASDRQLPEVLRNFSYFASFALAFVAWHELRRRPGLRLDTALPVLTGLAVAFLFLGIVTRDAARSWDYTCYEDAARAVVRGESPYGGGYLYPPLAAQSMALAFRTARAGAALAGLEVRDPVLWNGVFYFYQCLQWYLLVGGYLLTHRLARRAGLASLPASALSACLFILNTPLLRTLQEKQVNLWLLDLFLAALLSVWRFPFWSGWAAALGAHIKLYPVMLAAPWLAARRWKALAGLAAGIVGLALLGLAPGSGLAPWLDFPQALRGSSARLHEANLGVPGILHNALARAGFQTDGGLRHLAPLVTALSTLLRAALVVWFARRFLGRERAFRKSAPAGSEAHFARLMDHSLDALALGLLLSPVLWDHHLTLLIPLAAWTIARRAGDLGWQAPLGTFLLFALPDFAIFPLGWHRLAGLVMLLCVRPPAPRASAPERL